MLKWGFDRVMAAVGLAVLAVPMAMIAVVVMVAGRTWCPFFRQERIGRGGRPFKICKFRTMSDHPKCSAAKPTANSSQNTTPDAATEPSNTSQSYVADSQATELNNALDDDRLQYILPDNELMTPMGRWLRRTKIDELPELWNVLNGDMSFVGPRPDVAGYADKLTGDDRLILELRPGITCEASIKYANEEELLAKQPDPLRYNDEVIYPDKVRMNLEYYHNHSFWCDIKIIWRTLFR